MEETAVYQKESTTALIAMAMNAFAIKLDTSIVYPSQVL